MKLVIKLVLNIFLFVIYSLVGMNIVNFIYDLILSLSGNPVPLSNDPVHLKIAGIIFVIVSLFTLIFRKYFYLKLFKYNTIGIKEDVIKSVSFDEIDRRVDEDFKKNNLRKKKKNIKKEVNILKEGDIEIFMGKEIK